MTDYAAALTRLPVLEPFDADRFVEAVAIQRGRPILLRSLTERVANGACGLLLRRATDDVIFVHETGDSMRRSLIVAHEIAHLVLDHGRDEELHIGIAQFLAGAIVDGGPEDVVRARTNYTQAEERDAEILARKIVAGRRRTRHGDPVIARLLEHL